MRNVKEFFTWEDFSKDLKFLVETSGEEITAQMIASKANAILEEHVGPKVTGIEKEDVGYCGGVQPLGSDTDEAYLFCVREIEK